MKSPARQRLSCPPRANTYTGYSIGCAVAWAVLWAIYGPNAEEEKINKLRLFFAGWFAGWTSATIARAVYPPPKPRG